MPIEWAKNLNVIMAELNKERSTSARKRFKCMLMNTNGIYNTLGYGRHSSMKLIIN